MTDNEIVKALEDAVKIGDAPIGKYWGCMISKLTAKEAIDLINRQKAYIAKCEKVIDIADKTIATQQAEIERLKTNLNIELENYATEYDNKIKAEAYREFAERIKLLNQNNLILWNEQIDNILKELVGEDDG